MLHELIHMNVDGRLRKRTIVKGIGHFLIPRNLVLILWLHM